MVATRSAGQSVGEHALLDALLSVNTSRARVLLAAHPGLALEQGPSGFGCLHAAALVDAHRLVAPLAAAGLSPDQQIEPLNGPAAFSLRSFLRDHSKLPASKLCAVFRGVTPLHIAAWLGHLGTVEALLEAGADVERPCLEGRTALAIACYFLDCRPKRSLGIIGSLLDHGADPLCADFHGISSLVLSPHCPAHIQQLLLDRVLERFGGQLPPAGSGDGDDGMQPEQGGGAQRPAEAAGGAGDGLPGPSGSSDGAGTSAGSSSRGADAKPGSPGAGSSGGGGGAPAAAGGDEAGAAAAPPAWQPPPGLDLPPEKHVDVLQASLGAKHWPAFDYFLDATSFDAAYPQHSVSRILSLAIMSGDTSLVLRVLRSGLRPDPCGNNSQGHPHVAVAAVHGHEAVLDVLCAAGGAVTLKALHHATDTRSLRGLQLLLARGRPCVLEDAAPVHIGGAHSRSGELCVMLRLLRDTAFRLRYCYRIDMPRHAADSLAMVECLAAAGYRPTVYPQAIVHSGWIDLQGRVVANYDPTQDKPAAFDLQGVNKYTWLAARCEPWSPARHAQFPLRFKAAMRQLLLVHHRSEQGDGGGGAQRAQQLAARGAKRACVASPVPQAQQQRVTRSMRSGKAGRGAASKQPPKQPRGVAKRRGLKSGGAEPPRRHGVRGSAAGAASGRSTRSGGGGGGGTAVEPAVVAAEAPRAATALQAARGPPVAGPSSLPPELLLHIIGKAAFPVSAWL